MAARARARLAERGRQSRGPVAQERSIGEILGGLRGAARQAWLDKWRRLLQRLLDTYGVDEQELGVDLSRDESLEYFLREWCLDLTEPECAGKVRELVEQRGVKTAEQLAYEAAMGELERYEREMGKIDRALRLFKLPLDLTPDEADTLLEIYRNPEWDGEEVEGLVRRVAERLGYGPEEASKLAAAARRVVEERAARVERSARGPTVALVTEVLRVARRVSRRRVERARKRADLILERFLAERPKRLVNASELTLWGARLKRPSKAGSPGEAARLLEGQGYRRLAPGERLAVGPGVLLVPFGDPSRLWCEARELGGQLVLERCDGRLVVVDTGAGVYASWS